jgi:hypothetical protein
VTISATNTKAITVLQQRYGVFYPVHADAINRTAAEARRQLGNPEEKLNPPLQTVTRRVMKTVPEDTRVCATVMCE